jgi:hypothetical protein
MRLRRLQQWDEVEGWYDDAYIYENEGGKLVFCYNLTWERVGARYNKKFAETGVSLEEIETILPLDGQTMRWLPVEVIEADQVEAFLAELDEKCAIPKPRSISVSETLAA